MKNNFLNESVALLILVYYLDVFIHAQNTTEILSSSSTIQSPCFSSPCMNNGTCYSYDFDDGFKCACTQKYYGADCSTAAFACISNPCLNNGTCSQLNGMSYICYCPSNYYGLNCQLLRTPCSPNRCNINQNCTIDGKNSFFCDCIPGWHGVNCDKYLNPCSSNPCQIYETCSVSGNLFSASYYCTSSVNTKYGVRFFTFVGIPLLMLSFCTGLLFICVRSSLFRKFKRNTPSSDSSTTTIRRSTSGQIVYIISSQIDQPQQDLTQPDSALNSAGLLGYNEAVRFSVLSEKDNENDNDNKDEEELPTYQDVIVNNENLKA